MKRLLFWLRLFVAGVFGAALAHYDIWWYQPKFWVIMGLSALLSGISALEADA